MTSGKLPDRSHVLTEQRNERSMTLHTLGTGQIAALIHREDRAAFEAVEAAQGAIARFLEAAEPGFLSGGRIVYVGAGTSGRLGVLDASECPPTFQTEPSRVVGIIAGGDRSLRQSSEGLEDDPRGAIGELESLGLGRKDVLIGIAAGGTTPYVLGALEWAKSRGEGPMTALISCSPVADGARGSADHVIEILTGPEVVTGSTRMKAGTATKLVLNTITTTLMIREGRVYENLMVDVRATNAKLRDRAARIIATLTQMPREAALALLDKAGGSVKTAIVMEKRGMDRAAAEELVRGNPRLDRLI